jgi:hypothetical protein
MTSIVPVQPVRFKRNGRCRRGRTFVSVCVASTVWAFCTVLADGPRPPGARAADSSVPAVEAEGLRLDRPWHIELGFRDGCTRLDETSRLLDQRLDRPLRFDVFDLFDSPRTPLDRKSDFLLTTLYLGLGRQESDRLIWTFYLGGGMGRESDHQRKANINLDVSFKYAYAYTGLTAEIYPWKTPARTAHGGLEETLRASRPFLAAGLETGYVSAEGRGHWKIAPFPRIYQDKVKVRDWITSVNFGVGWNIPVNHRWSVVLIGDYRSHFHRPDEYNGWTLTTALRYNLR